MSWSVTFNGGLIDVEKQFRAGAAAAELNNLPPLEIVDIGDVGNLVRIICMRNGVDVQGSASGHWSGDHFQSINLSINFMKKPETEGERETRVGGWRDY